MTGNHPRLQPLIAEMAQSRTGLLEFSPCLTLPSMDISSSSTITIPQQFEKCQSLCQLLFDRRKVQHENVLEWGVRFHFLVWQ